MSDLNNDLEAMVGQMGMNISEEPSTNNEPAPAPQETPEEPVAAEPQQSPEPAQAEPQSAAAEPQEPQSSLQDDDSELSEEELEATILQYMSERLGREVNSFDDFTGNQNTSTEIDERVAAINEFVRQTGRDPQDWFTYQAMNPSEMDDMSAVKNQLMNQYGDLSDSDLNLLVENKYKLDADLYDESEVRLAQIQLKMDADKARQEIEDLRSQYAVPQREEQQTTEPESFIDEQWINNMSAEVDALEGIEFEVSKDKSFTFGLDDSYKSELKSKNENIEDFFSAYTDKTGNWNFEKWNMHQAVLDNIETIVRSAYQQGLGEGQRGLVDKAANVQTSQPSQAGNTGNNVKSLEEQVKQALGMNDNGLTFKI
jgi:hypothetical protein